ncbi:hypothetical protein [Quadrisphaera sp. DSM 44207]|uniref:hypothetical protein n=1 Tax=Quadrisphaera sp. DSM 44207 TaxID=1881057 RepID=UPI000887998B|nr:hypothetical protein [Quadrisphaera sp. DSM 44207]SDQ85499.1 hypothetical protein SAMN05428996_2906 [Quadrisphaera sp. DSM 44207]
MSTADGLGAPGDGAGTGGLVAAVAAAASPVGAVLGGLAGTRFHREVDEAGLGL